MKLHLGCGKKYIEGFTHIDGIGYDHVDKVTDLKNLSFLKNESVELIYASHVIEHFGRNEINKVLLEWNRVLKRNGTLRLAVPDFEKIVHIYNAEGDIGLIKGLVCGRQDNKYNFHYNIFDFLSIKDLLEESGFKNIKKYDWRETEHANVDDFSQAYLPHMDKENGILMSLNVECNK